MSKGRVICVDIDGTLARGVAWNEVDCLSAEPNLELIARIAEMYQSNYIIIHTARRDNLIPATLEWLRRNNVRYHAISNLKSPADLYIDDKALRPEEM